MTDANARLARPLLLAVAATLVVLVLIAGFPVWTRGFGPAATTAASYLAVWVPMGIAIALVAARVGFGLGAQVGSAFGMPRFRWSDLGRGFAVGLLCTALASVLTLALTGSPAPAGSVHVTGSLWTLGYLVPNVVIPIVIAPFIEEWFFRGVWLGGVRAALPASLPVATRDALAIAASAVVFALLHLSEYSGHGVYTVISLVELLAVGAGCGVLVVRTGRLGGAMVAHAVYNALIVLITWPW